MKPLLVNAPAAPCRASATREVDREESGATWDATQQVFAAMNGTIAVESAAELEEIRDGRLQLDTPVTASARASQMGGSQIFAKEGQAFPVQTLLAALMIQSANDAAEMLAEKIAGSAENFADLMNQRAKALGLTNSTFYDPHGLPNSEDPKRIDMMSTAQWQALNTQAYLNAGFAPASIPAGVKTGGRGRVRALGSRLPRRPRLCPITSGSGSGRS